MSIPSLNTHIPRHNKAINFKGVAAFQVPRDYRSWVFDTGSLTQRLIAATRGQFRVHVLKQFHGGVSKEEHSILGLAPRALPFIREVELICNNSPWVYARTIIPRATEAGPGRYLTRLGNQPLGAALFTDPDIYRGNIWIRQSWITIGDQAHRVWGRQRVFYIKEHPLLVSEYFLPPCPMYTNN